MEFENENINEQPVSENTDEQVTDNVYQLMTRLDMETDINKIDTEYLKVMESYKIYL